MYFEIKPLVSKSVDGRSVGVPDIYPKTNLMETTLDLDAKRCI